MGSLEINDNAESPSPKETKTHASKNKISLLLLRTKICLSTCFLEVIACNFSYCVSSSTADKIVRVITNILSTTLISLALSLLFFLSYVFFNIYLEILLAPIWVKTLHTAWVLFLICNITFNYYKCVMTRHDGENYDLVVRELANVTGFDYPETKEEKLDWKMDYERKIKARRQKIQGDSSTTKSTTTVITTTTTTTDIESGIKTTTTTTKRKIAGSNDQNAGTAMRTDSFHLNPSKENVDKNSKGKKPPGKIYTWMLLGPQEWGYCFRTNQPKPPRSHYEDTVRALVLNMDHFCPWMFNTIGYFNYRYFCNVLIYAFVGMVYGSLVTFRPFWYSFMDRTLTQKQHEMSVAHGYSTDQHLIPLVPTNDEHVFILICFIMCSALAAGVFALMSFHIYLVFTAQTTVECHGNYTKKRKAKKEGKTWKNPYDLGWKLNWQHVYGSQHPLIAMLPSSRQPEYLPVPIDGKLHRR